MITILSITMFLLIIASTWWFGLWSNLITLVNLILSALAASSFYPNLAAMMLGKMPTYRFLVEFISIWLVFALVFFVMRGMTDTLSRMRLRFDFLTETIGRSLLSLIIAWVFVCFALFTMQLAPLPPNVFTKDGDTTATGAIGPDKLWVDFVRSRSQGAFSAAAAFDPKQEFFQQAITRRRLVSESKTLRVN